jgi:hypothetical protein
MTFEIGGRIECVLRVTIDVRFQIHLLGTFLHSFGNCSILVENSDTAIGTAINQSSAVQKTKKTKEVDLLFVSLFHACNLLLIDWQFALCNNSETVIIDYAHDWETKIRNVTIEVRYQSLQIIVGHLRSSIFIVVYDSICEQWNTG